MKCRGFTSKVEKAPGNRLLPDHFQTALLMLPPDWAEKSLYYSVQSANRSSWGTMGVFLHDSYCITILNTWFVHQRSGCKGKFHFNFPR